jgi:hypothetical protein
LAETLADLEVDDVLAFNASRPSASSLVVEAEREGSAAMFVTRKIVE